MSASERLAALARDRPVFFDAGYHMYEPADGEQRVMSALPEIVAVVRAAESAHICPDMHRDVREKGYAELSDALAALDEKLTDAD